MIILQNIKWTNFLSTGNYWTEIDLLASKTTLFCGKNGSGKSTISDAICYALFGKPFRKVNKPELINSITTKNMIVEIEFSTDSGQYKIRRGMKPNIFEVYADNQLIDQSADSRDYQRVLEQNVLKMDYKTFIQKVLIGNANFTPFMQLPAQARRQVVEDLLDIQIFSQMNILLKIDAQQNRDSISENEKQTIIVEKTIDLYKHHNAQVQKDTASIISGKRISIREYQEANVADAAELEKLQEFITKAIKQSKNRTQLQQEHNEFSRQRELEKAELNNKKRQHDFFCRHDQCPTCQQEISQKKKAEMKVFDNVDYSTSETLQILEQQIEALDAKLDQYDKLDKAIRTSENKASDLISKINFNNRSISNLESDIAALQKNKEQLKSYEQEEQQLEALHQQKAKLLEQRELFNIALMLLKDTGIKANIIKQYIPIINKLINKYLELMEFFCQFEVDENFNEKIRARHRDEYSYESFSEGEKMRMNLAILFTWRDIAKLRNSSACNLLILDEIMDSSLDSNGTDEFLKIIQQLTQGNNVIIISHKTDQIQDKFDRIVEFEKTKNFSTVKEAA